MNAMIWDPWNPTPVTRGRPVKVRSAREPILMGPIPRVQVKPPDDPDAVTTATPAARIQETTSGTATQSATERTSVRLPDAEAEGAPPVQRTGTTPSVTETTTTETTSQTTTRSSARALVELVGNEDGEDSQPVQMRRSAALMAECEESSLSDDIAEPRRTHLEKLTKVKDTIIKVVPRTDATTGPLTGRWVDTMQDDGARKARWTTRGYEQTLNGYEDFFSATPALVQLKNVVGRCSFEGARCGNRRLQRGLLPVTFEPGRNGTPSVDRASSRGRAGTRQNLESRVSIPRSQGSTESFHVNGAVTI